MLRAATYVRDQEGEYVVGRERLVVQAVACEYEGQRYHRLDVLPERYGDSMCPTRLELLLEE